jgi:transcriptional regulator with GAF, ATPase, and Fis domain
LLAVLAKPFAIALSNVLEHQEVLKQRNLLIDDNRFLNREILSYVGEDIIGGNSGLRNVMEMVKVVAPLNTTVLLLGETGTGKEVIANAIHLTSQRKDGPFIKINCGAIAENLVDDELFGHEKGAFTGAVAEKRGRFERASGGTLFLDEIGELPLQSQVRFLRVLQSKEISRVGGDAAIDVDVRVIAATNRDLKQMVSEKLFREDLWFRLNIFPIHMPPLRQRIEDIPALVIHFLTLKSKELGIGTPPHVALGCLERLMDYHWPGNVRELENLVERELILNRGEPLRFNFLLPGDGGGETVSTPEEPVGGLLSLDDVISLHLRKVLKMTNGKINGPGGAAELLRVVPNTLRGRMRRLGITHGKKKS